MSVSPCYLMYSVGGPVSMATVNGNLMAGLITWRLPTEYFTQYQEFIIKEGSSRFPSFNMNSCQYLINDLNESVINIVRQYEKCR